MAFGSSAEVWPNLETEWQLSRVRRPDPAIAKRARKSKR
jgi:plasmid maintenance system antidote protein VapI